MKVADYLMSSVSQPLAPRLSSQMLATLQRQPPQLHEVFSSLKAQASQESTCASFEAMSQRWAIDGQWMAGWRGLAWPTWTTSQSVALFLAGSLLTGGTGQCLVWLSLIGWLLYSIELIAVASPWLYGDEHNLDRLGHRWRHPPHDLRLVIGLTVA